MSNADLLRDQINILAGEVTTRRDLQSDAAQSALATEALSLITIELRKLDALLLGQSRLPEDKVYLSVWSLNKGLQEVGGDWQNDSLIQALIQSATQYAYAAFKQARPKL